MNGQLWKKSMSEGKWLLAACSLGMFAYHWLWVWLTGQISIRHMKKILTEFVPEFVQDLFPVPIEVLASSTGRIAMGYEEPIVVVLVCVWAIARGSDSVSGEIGRGTMEMLLAQPIRRLDVLVTHVVVTLLGSAVLAAFAWLGTYVGVATVTLEEQVSAWDYLPAAANLFCLGVFVAGLSMLASSFDRNRGRTIGLVVGFYVVQVVIKTVGLLAKDLAWLGEYSALSNFEPQILVSQFHNDSQAVWSLLWQYNGPLIYLGLAGFLVSAVIFCRRDVPAPL